MPLNRTAAARSPASTPRISGCSRSSATRSAGAPAAMPGAAQAEAAGAVTGEAAPERRRRACVAVGHEHVAAPALAARAALGLAGLLERIEADVGVGAERDRHAALPQLGGRQEAVAEVGLGRRAGAHGRAGLARAGRARRGEACVACTTVAAGPSTPQSRRCSIGRRPNSSSDSATSRGCSAAWMCSG